MNHKHLIILITIFFAGVIISGCASNPENLSSTNTETLVKYGLGNPQSGLLAFNDHCFECHSTQEGQAIAGPSLFEAGEKFSYNYVKESIERPHAIVVQVENPQFENAEMPEGIVAELTEQELEDIVSYILSQIAEAGAKIEN